MARRNRLDGLSRQPRPSTANAVACALLAVAWTSAASGCAVERQAPPNVDVGWRLTPWPARVGSAQLALTLRDEARRPLRRAVLGLEAYMSHPGMAPIRATGVERAPGTYDLRLQFTMRGDWVLLVTATLADGRRVTRRIDVPNVQPPRPPRHGEVDH